MLLLMPKLTPPFLPITERIRTGTGLTHRIWWKDIPSLRISFPSLTYYVKDGLHIPEYGKTITRGQGISIIENMNEWTWDSE